MPTVKGVWTFDDVISLHSGTRITQDVNFTANGQAHDSIHDDYGDYYKTSVHYGYDDNYARKVYDGVDGWVEKYKTIDFGTEPQTVSTDFYIWLMANATASTIITYNGKQTDVVVGKTATLKCAGKKMLSDVTIATSEGAKGYVIYDGDVRLPSPPSEVLADYPYAWIRKDSDNGVYDLALGKDVFYYTTKTTSSSTTYSIYQAKDPHLWYQIDIASAGTATEWVLKGETQGRWNIKAKSNVKWSNHDIPNGSATATQIYFWGSHPTHYAPLAKITYGGNHTDVIAGKNATLSCDGKCMKTDVLIESTFGNQDAAQYFDLKIGRISTAAPSYLSTSITNRVSYTGTDVVLVPHARYKLMGNFGVRYGLQPVSAAGLAEIQAGSNMTSTNKTDLGWQQAGFVFTTDENAAVCWITASYENNTDILPDAAMPVCIKRIG